MPDIDSQTRSLNEDESNDRPEKDMLQRFSFDEAPVRGEIAHLNQSLQDVLSRHSYPDAVADELAQLMAAAALMSANLKFEGRLTLQLRFEGVVSLLQAETDHKGQLRAIARYNDQAPPESLTTIQFDNGQLVITLEPEQGQRYQGITAIQGGDIAKALEDYFEQSEQLSTRIWLTSDRQTAAGFLLQKLPDAPTDTDTDAWNRITQLADTLKQDELLTLSNQVLLHRLYHDEQVRVYPGSQLSFYCTCSRSRLGAALKQVGESEVRDMLNETPVLSIQCEFCLQGYEFRAQDLPDLFAPPKVH